MACGEVPSGVDPKHMHVTSPPDVPSFPFTPLSMNSSLPRTSAPESSSPPRLPSEPYVPRAGRSHTRLDLLESVNGIVDKSPRGQGVPARPCKAAALHDRFGYVLDQAREVGFDNFDALVSTYYTADFRNSPDLSNEQRLSRMRRLPDLLAAVRDSSTRWTQRERQGYQDEILKSGENILSAECSKFSQSNALRDEFIRISRSGQDQSLLPGLNAAIRNVLQDEVRLCLQTTLSIQRSNFNCLY